MSCRLASTPLGTQAKHIARQHRPARKTEISAWVKSGGHVFAIGLGEADLAAVLPFKVSAAAREHIAFYFEPAAAKSPLAGVSPADVLNRDPRNLLLIREGANMTGNGVLATAADAKVVFCQIAPWEFDASQSSNLKRTFRRASVAVS